VANEAYYVARTLQALELLTFQPAAAAQLARSLGVHARTARRLLARLEAEGWLRCTRGRARVYAPTRRLVALAAHVAARSPLALAAAPIVGEVSQATSTEAQLIVPSYHATQCLVRATHGNRGQLGLRELTSCCRTAAAKVLLAHRPAWCSSVLEAPPRPGSLRPPGDRTELERELAAIRAGGMAVEHEQQQPAVRAIAIPVRDEDNNVIAALAVKVPGTAVDEERLHELVDDLASGAAAITYHLNRGERDF
jgi:DNA-binding IclR family transcriptional regulator